MFDHKNRMSLGFYEQELPLLRFCDLATVHRVAYASRNSCRSLRDGSLVLTHQERELRRLVRRFSFARIPLRFSRASIFSRSSFDTESTCLRALSNRSYSVLPGTFGAGNGFMP